MMAALAPSGSDDLILKFDVEGAEWEALENVSAEKLKRFRIIVCELHNLPGIEFNGGLYEKAVKVIAALSKYHRVVHVHANNCCGMTIKQNLPIPYLAEFTFLRKDRANFTASHAPIPGPLDYRNVDTQDEIHMDIFSFY
jgi:hypothetical protein